MDRTSVTLKQGFSTHGTKMLRGAQNCLGNMEQATLLLDPHALLPKKGKWGNSKC